MYVYEYESIHMYVHTLHIYVRAYKYILMYVHMMMMYIRQQPKVTPDDSSKELHICIHLYICMNK